MRWIDRLALLTGRVLAWTFPTVAVMMGYEVIARYAFGAPTVWAHEVAGLLAGVAFIAGGAYCMADRSHMRVTLIFDRFTGLRARLAETLSLVCGAIFLSGLAFAMWGILQRAFFRFSPDGAWNPERSGSSWNTPAPAFLKLALFVGALLFLAVVLRHLVALWRDRDHDT